MLEPRQITIKPFEDLRGSLSKIFLKEHGVITGLEIAEMYISRSRCNVVRGLHFQLGEFAQDKYIFCTNGRLIDISVSIDPASFGRVYVTHMDAKSNFILAVPGSCAHGIISLEEDTTFINFSPNPYTPGNERGLLWNSVGYDFGIESPILSDKDMALPTLQQYKKEMGL